MKVKNKKLIFGIILSVLNLLVVIDIILCLAVAGAGNIILSIFPYILGTAIYGFVLFSAEKNSGVWWGLTVVSVCKAVFTLLPEVVIDILINGLNYAADGFKFLTILFFIILIFVLLIAELAYSTANIVSIYKKAEIN